jgi:class 3 adenylate cyclase/tetratricopeptide (TPR) repeat protein
VNPEGQRFCGHCGTPIGTEVFAGQSEAPVAERKLATVLFADVVGFTSLAERTDAELVARMVDSAFQEMGRVVAEHGGTVDKFMGDSLMAVFGVPVAHDDDAERAVAAGLAMRQLGGDLVFSIGINSGEVMATTVGSGDLTVIGDTVNTAARLEKAAGPGEVLCGRLTAELARHRVDFQERQPVLLKGKSEPVAVWEAVRLRSNADERPWDAALVGRDEDLAMLELQWRRVRDGGEARLVVLCGEAGAGKTRLLDELGRVVSEHATVVRSAYPAYGVVGGLRVAADLISQLGSSSDPEVETRVRSVVGVLDPSLRAIDAEGLRHEQLWALARLLKEKACDRPLVILVDDLHGADDRTLELLGELAVRMREVPIFTVVAGRTDPGTWLGRFSAATTVHLGPLARAHAAALAQMLVGDKRLAPEASDFLVDMANGNALYLRELVSMAKARNMLVDDGDCFRITAHTGIPATVQALLAARLDALDRGQKQVVQHVAVLGRAGVDQVAALGARDAVVHVHALVDMGLLRQGPDGAVEAADPLLREVAYEMLPHNVRGELHRLAADRAVVEEERARHLERAAEFLADDAALAAEAAEALAAEGASLLEASRELDAMAVLTKAVALGLRATGPLLELARLQSDCGLAVEAMATLDLVADDPEDPAVAVEREHRRAVVHLFSDPAQALSRLADVTARWRALGNTGKEAWARANAGVAHFYLSQMEESADQLETGLTLFESIGDKAGMVSCSSFLCLVKPADPRVDGWLSDALDFAGSTGDRNRQVATLVTLTWKHFFKAFGGTPDAAAQAEEFGRRLAGVAEEIGAGEMAEHGRSLLALMARMTGRFDEAAAQVTALQRVLAAGRTRDTWLAWAASFSVAVATGAGGAAAPFPPEGSVDPVVTMAGLMVLIELVLAGRVDEALARFERTGPPALDGPMADVGGLAYAVALVLAGRGSEARPFLERGLHGAQVLHGTAAETLARALLSEVAGIEPPPVPSAPAQGLADLATLRAWARAGDAEALAALRRGSKALAAPGLLIGLD